VFEQTALGSQKQPSDVGKCFVGPHHNRRQRVSRGVRARIALASSGADQKSLNFVPANPFLSGGSLLSYGEAMAVADLHVSCISLSYYALSIVADDDSGKVSRLAVKCRPEKYIMYYPTFRS
jgi:hypothetical protein